MIVKLPKAKVIVKKSNRNSGVEKKRTFRTTNADVWLNIK